MKNNEENLSPAARRRMKIEEEKAGTPYKSPAQLKREERLAQEGKVEEARSGDGRDQSGNARSQGGNARSQSGNARSQSGNARSQGGNARSQSGNVRSQGGNARSQGGNARSQSGQSSKIANTNAKQSKAKNAKKVKKDIIGTMLSNIQFIATFVFLASLSALGLLPWLYVGVIAFVVLVLAFMVKFSQSKRNKNRGFGKLCSVAISAMMFVGAYYCIIILLLLMNISGENDSTADLSQDTYSVYISGVDVYGEVDQSSRSDVNLVTTVNPLTGQALLTTTPRDYYVLIPGVSGDQKDKLTHAGNYGVETSMATLEQLYDEEIEFYIRLNFTSFIDIIDVLGGVTVDSEIAFTTSENSGYVTDIVEGENELSGEEALAFVRERYNLEDGDTQRGINQQIMLESIFKELMSPTTIFKMSDILECIEGEVETNMTTSQIQACSRGVLSSGLGLNIYSVAASGTSDRAYCYSYTGNSLYVTIPDQDSVDEISSLMDNVALGEVLPE